MNSSNVGLGYHANINDLMYEYIEAVKDGKNKNNTDLYTFVRKHISSKKYSTIQLTEKLVKLRKDVLDKRSITNANDFDNTFMRIMDGYKNINKFEEKMSVFLLRFNE